MPIRRAIDVSAMKQVLYWTALALCAAAFVLSWHHPPQPQEGEPCGPHHHWKSVGLDRAVMPDLSCEED